MGSLGVGRMSMLRFTGDHVRLSGLTRWLLSRSELTRLMLSNRWGRMRDRNARSSSCEEMWILKDDCFGDLDIWLELSGDSRCRMVVQ